MPAQGMEITGKAAGRAIGSAVPLTIVAPAKINLYLHVTGRRDDGYHFLDSLVCFADYGDSLTLRPAADFALSIDGPFAAAFSAGERKDGRDGDNIVTRAILALAQVCGRAPDIAVTLTKNLPLAAGMGGGSADAAAAVRGALALWDIPPASVPELPALLLRLGADVPVCFAGRPALLRGIGDDLTPVDGLPSWPAVIVNPLRACATADIFRMLAPPFRAVAARGDEDWMTFLRARGNDLIPAARAREPVIDEIMDFLKNREGFLFGSMSGSGATCFALYERQEQADEMAEIIRTMRPAWWVRAVVLNPPASGAV